MNKKIILITLIILSLIIFNYSFIDDFLKDFFEVESYVEIERIIDGDTVVAEGKNIRLLGINTPEKGEKYYTEAKEYLEKIILDKRVKLEYGNEKKDRYGRTLAYIFYNNTNINKKIIEKGYGNIYFPSGKTKYYEEFLDTWKRCIKKDIRLCEKSEDVCGICIKIHEVSPEKDAIKLRNSCGKDCDLSEWSIKDEGRKKFVFESIEIEGGKTLNIITKSGKNNETHVFWDEYKYVLTNSGDSVFLRDNKGKLVDWKSY